MLGLAGAGDHPSGESQVRGSYSESDYTLFRRVLVEAIVLKKIVQYSSYEILPGLVVYEALSQFTFGSGRRRCATETARVVRSYRERLSASSGREGGYRVVAANLNASWLRTPPDIHLPRQKGGRGRAK